jgi:hypothetical protein
MYTSTKALYFLFLTCITTFTISLAGLGRHGLSGTIVSISSIAVLVLAFSPIPHQVHQRWRLQRRLDKLYEANHVKWRELFRTWAPGDTRLIQRTLLEEFDERYPSHLHSKNASEETSDVHEEMVLQLKRSIEIEERRDVFLTEAQQRLTLAVQKWGDVRLNTFKVSLTSILATNWEVEDREETLFALNRVKLYATELPYVQNEWRNHHRSSGFTRLSEAQLENRLESMYTNADIALENAAKRQPEE